MHVYRFLIKFEDMMDFSRDVDVLADQTFADFYKTLSENLKLNAKHLASFYICDHNFRKKTEIPLSEIIEDNRPKKVSDDDEDEEQEKESFKPVLMKDAYLNEFIDDPHQRLLLVYDAINQWTFYIEMIKIYPSSEASEYPLVSKSEGDIPRELGEVKVDIPAENDEDTDDVDIPDADAIDDSAFYNEEEIEKMKAEDVTSDGGFEIEENSEISDFSDNDMSGNTDED